MQTIYDYYTLNCMTELNSDMSLNPKFGKDLKQMVKLGIYRIHIGRLSMQSVSR